MRPFQPSAILCCSGILACAPAVGVQAPVPEQEPGETRILQEAVAAADAANAYELVQTLRPDWLRTRGAAVASDATPQTLVFLDNRRRGVTEALRGIPLEQVGTMRYLTGGAERTLVVGEEAEYTTAVIAVFTPAYEQRRTEVLTVAPAPYRRDADAPEGLIVTLYPLAASSRAGDVGHVAAYEADGWTRSYSVGSPVTLMASLRIPLTHTLSLEAMGSRRLAEETETYVRGGATVHHVETSTAGGVLASVHVGPARLGVGPIAHLVELKWAAGECQCVAADDGNILVGGAAFDLAAGLPQAGALFGEIRVQGRWLRDARKYAYRHLPHYQPGGMIWFVGLGFGWRVTGR